MKLLLDQWENPSSDSPNAKQRKLARLFSQHKKDQQHQLLAPVAEYCCQNSEKDRPEIEQLVSGFKDSLKKAQKETETLIQSLPRYHIPDALIWDDDPVQPENTPAAEEQPSAE